MKKLKKILRFSIWGLLIAGVAVLLGFIELKQFDRPVRKILINITYGKADVLITVSDIDSILKKKGVDKGKPMGMINTAAIENLIRRQAYVSRVKVYETNEGYLNIDILQREPILRIVNQDQEGFYLDREGNPLPLNPGYPVHVLVVNGFIRDSYLKNPKLRVSSSNDPKRPDSLLTGLHRLALFIMQDPYFKKAIDQVYVNEQQELELIPWKGNHVVLLGNTEDLEEKLQKLYIFYTKGLDEIGWNKYQVINIKYKNQVVCSKL